MKKFVSCLLTLALLISCMAALPASAEEPTEPGATAADLVEGVDYLPCPGNKEVFTLDQLPAVYMDAPALANGTSLPDVAAMPLEEIGSISSNPMARSANSVTYTFTEVITDPTMLKSISLALAPGQIVQANLECPQNANLMYDLYLLELGVDGNTIVATCQYGTYMNICADGVKRTADKGVAYVNTSGVSKDYAVAVASAAGSSATDSFNLTVSLDVAGSYDGVEPLENAYEAYQLPSQGLNLNGANLNVPNDQDWFVWTCPQDYDSASFQAIPAVSGADYTVELYTVKNVSGRPNMILHTPESGSEYYVRPGSIYYIRVMNNPGAVFKYGGYTLSIQLKSLIPATFEVVMDGDRGPDAFPPYPEAGGRQILKVRDGFWPHVTVGTAHGYGVPGRKIHVKWYSPAYENNNMNYTRDWDSLGVTDNGGEYHFLNGDNPEKKIEIVLPCALGQHSYYVGSIAGGLSATHYYDLDAVTISVVGTNLSKTEPLFHFFYSDLN